MTQYVGVQLGNKVYTYEWRGEVPMVVGDRAVIPANYLNEYPSFGNVVKIYGEDEEIPFKGTLAKLLGKVELDDRI